MSGKNRSTPGRPSSPGKGNFGETGFPGSSAEKKAAVMGNKKKHRLPIFGIASVLLVIAAAGLYWSGVKRSNGARTIPSGENTLNASGTHLSFAESMFDDGKARHFQHRDGDLQVRFFIVKSSDGVIRAAFDACDVCWPAGKGYGQSGDYMVCRNCGQRFASIRVNEVKGGCNPAPLERAVQNGRVTIQVQDLLEGKSYFDFPGKA